MRAMELKQKKKSFEDLRVFQDARQLANLVYLRTKSGPLAREYYLVDQMRRSSLSIVCNIAEGFERGSDAEFVRFLYIARGSCGELRAQLLLAHDQKLLSSEAYAELKGLSEKVSRQLFRLIQYLKSSGASK
jgi:four helix bundle protein